MDELNQEQLNQILTRLKQDTKIQIIRGVLDFTRKPTLFNSKLGGIPYWPTDVAYPRTTDGKPLALLAQLNCAGLPLTTELTSILPNQGMLQFFILPDELYGMDFDNQTNQNRFRVIYHPTVDYDVKPLSRIPNSLELEDFPVNGSILLEPTIYFDSANPLQYDFKEHFVRAATELSIELPVDFSLYDVLPDDMWEELLKNAAGHKILGYPFFTQSDPRENRRYANYDTLLLQIDSDYDRHRRENVLFGDCGIANFFINREKLKQRDFSDVLYNWDCY